MYNNLCIEKIYFEKVEEIGEDFLHKNQICQQVFLTNTRIIGNSFMYSNKKEIKAFFLKLKEIPAFFLFNSLIQTLIIPEVIEIGDIFILKDIQYLYAPNLMLDNYKDFKSIFEDIPYCYTPLMPECCNTTDFLQDEDIVDSIKLELKKNNNHLI